jgi:nucleoside-diphosphate-sugar epimerase
MIKRIVYVSGYSGFVGKNIFRYFLNNPLLKCAELNLRESLDNVFFDKNAAVLHLAGKAHDLRSTQDEKAYYEINYELTKKVFDAFIRSEASVFIFMSSVKAAADSVAGILTEETPAEPTTHYGRSKLMAEEYIKAQKLPEGKKYYILRPCMIHGPGNKGNLNLLYKFVSGQLPWPLGAFENRRSFLSIQNLCYVINELITRNDIEQGIYQVADDQALSTNELVLLIADTMGLKPRMLKLPKKLVNAMARAGDRLHLPFNSTKLMKLTENYVVSNQKLLNALGKPLPVDTAEGIQTTIRSFHLDK